MFDLRRTDWADELLGLAGVERTQLPELVAGGDAIGELTAAAAADLGLPGPVVLVAGTGDGQAAGLGADAGRPGEAYLNLGTSMVTGVVTDQYMTGLDYRTLSGPTAGTFVLETLLNSAGYLVEWFHREFATPDRDAGRSTLRRPGRYRDRRRGRARPTRLRRSADPAVLERRPVAALGSGRARSNYRVAQRPHAGALLPLVARGHRLRTARAPGRAGGRHRRGDHDVASRRWWYAQLTLVRHRRRRDPAASYSLPTRTR